MVDDFIADCHDAGFGQMNKTTKLAALLRMDRGTAQPQTLNKKASPRQRLRMNVHAPFTRTALTPPSGRCSHA